MNFRIVHLFAVCLLFLAIVISASAGEIYTWVDENGRCYVTDTPPEKPAKMIGKETYRPDSPEEIREFQQKQQNYERDLEERRRYNRAAEESNKRFDANMERRKEVIKQKEMERKQAAAERVDDLEARKARIRAIENRDYDEARRLRLKDDQRRTDRATQKYKEIENQ